MSAVVRLLLLTLTLPSAAAADLFVRYLPHPPPPDGKIYDNLDVYVSRGKVLMTGENRSGVSYSAWYDSADGKFRILDASRGGYYTLSMATFAGLMAQQKRYRRDMEAKLAGAPEAERPAMRRVLEQFENSVYGGAPPEGFEYRSTGTRAVQAGVECLEHEVLQAGQLVRMLCIADFDEVGVGATDLATLESMSRESNGIAFGTRRGFQLMPVYPLDLSAGFAARVLYLGSGRELRLERFERAIPKEVSLDSYKHQREVPLQLNQ